MNITHLKTIRFHRPAMMGGFLLLLTAGSAPARSALEKWSEGRYASGHWGGARTTLEEKGIAFGASWRGTFYGVADGGLHRGTTFDEELQFSLTVDFEKWAGIPGLSGYASVRWRDGVNPNGDVGASAAFGPSSYQLGKQWRLMPFYLTWQSGDLLPVENMITLSGGWQNPYHFFAQQPDSKLFLNNAITQTKGIGANGIPFNGAYEAWGGYLKVKPVGWHYVQAGLYAAVPNASDTGNHGLYLDLKQPPYRNGLYAMAETGVTPKIAGLPGKYAFGGYYWGLENTSFSGDIHDQKCGFYWQVDQMLFREPAGAGAAPAESTGKQGLYWIGFLNYAPRYNNALPFYFHTGLIYKGLFPGRDKDQLGAAFALGEYSDDQILARRAAGQTIQQTTESVLELDYRVQLTEFAYMQPFLQYIIRPNGTGVVRNATVLGLHMGVNF